jgi:hypothetical protein
MNKAQREARNALMISDRTAGMSLTEIAAKYGVGTQQACHITKGATLSTRDKIHARLEEHGLEGIRDWAVEQGIGYYALATTIKKAGHKMPRKITQKRVPTKVSKVYATIAALQGGATANGQHAARLGVTRQYIELVERYCEAAGVKL